MSKKRDITRALYLAKQRLGYQYGGYPFLDPDDPRAVELGTAQPMPTAYPSYTPRTTTAAPTSNAFANVPASASTPASAVQGMAAQNPFGQLNLITRPGLSNYQFYKGAGTPLNPPYQRPSGPSGGGGEGSVGQGADYTGGGSEHGSQENAPSPDIVSETKAEPTAPTAAEPTGKAPRVYSGNH